MEDTLWVKSGLTGEFAEKVALFEQHEDHPGGSVFVAGTDSPPVEAGRTATVIRMMHDGRIKEAAPGDLEKWRQAKAASRHEALLNDAAMFPGGQRGDLDNRIASLEAIIASMQAQQRAPRGAGTGKEAQGG